MEKGFFLHVLSFDDLKILNTILYNLPLRLKALRGSLGFLSYKKKPKKSIINFEQGVLSQFALKPIGKFNLHSFFFTNKLKWQNNLSILNSNIYIYFLQQEFEKRVNEILLFLNQIFQFNLNLIGKLNFTYYNMLKNII